MKRPPPKKDQPIPYRLTAKALELPTIDLRSLPGELAWIKLEEEAPCRQSS